MSIHETESYGQSGPWRHDFVLIDHHLPLTGNIYRGMTMQTKKQPEQRPQYAPLVDHYRAIGPAAILAALLHTTKKRKTSIASKAA